MMISGGSNGTQVRFDVISGDFKKFEVIFIGLKGSIRILRNVLEGLRRDSMDFRGLQGVSETFQVVSDEVSEPFQGASRSFSEAQGDPTEATWGFHGESRALQGLLGAFNRVSMTFQVRFKGVSAGSNKF